MPHELHQQDPAVFPNPKSFQADRFIVNGKAAIGTMRSFGGGVSACKGKTFAEKECLATVASIIMAWNMEPADGKAWKIPAARRATAVECPVGDIRVKIWRHKLRG